MRAAEETYCSQIVVFDFLASVILPQAIAAIMSTPRLNDLIQQYDGPTDFAEWVRKLELVAKLQKISNLEDFLPLFLSGKAFSVYDSLSDGDKADYESLKGRLVKAFSLNSFSAFDQLLSRRYIPGEGIDVYLSDLKRLVGLVGDIDDVLKCAFISGLPSDLQSQLKAAASLDRMTLPEIAERARTINFNERNVSAVAGTRSAANSTSKKVICFRCGESGHLARLCPSRRDQRRCFLCNDEGHLAAQCPKRQAENGSKNE